MTCFSLVSAAQFSSVGTIQRFPRTAEYQRRGDVVTVSVAFCISQREREERLWENCSDCVLVACKRMVFGFIAWVHTQECYCLQHQTFLLEVKQEGAVQGKGCWKCSIAEPMENGSWKRWVLLHPFRFH